MAGIYRISFRFYLARWSLCREKTARVRRAGKRIAAHKRKREKKCHSRCAAIHTDCSKCLPEKKTKLYASYQSIGVCGINRLGRFSFVFF